MELLYAIDDMDGVERAEARLAETDRLFKYYAEADDCLSGVAYEKFLDTIAQYVAQESVERAERRNIPSLANQPEDIRDYIRHWVDPNDDDVITREEAREGVQKAVNDIEGKEVVARRRQNF